MSSRRSRPSASLATQTPIPLPPYEPPSQALNPAAQRALTSLPQTHSLKKLKLHLETANGALTDMAGAVNDRLLSKQDTLKRRKARLAMQGGGVGEDEGEEERERNVRVMEERVEKLTREMERGTRRVIDSQVAVEGMEVALKEIAANARGSQGLNGTQASGRSQQSSGRRRRRSNDEDEERSDFEDIDESQAEAANSEEIVGPSKMFNQKLADQKSTYEALSMKSRYANNNEYIGFKRMMHDSLHPGEDGPPLPHASTWFPAETTTTSSTNPQPNNNNNNTSSTRHQLQTINTAANNHDDDDLAIASERISTKCPITLQNFKEPVSSKKCPHSFEKSAILSLINDSGMRTNGGNRGSGGEKAVKCPVCEMLLTPSDLHPNKILLRRIKRLQAASTSDSDSDSDPENKGSKSHSIFNKNRYNLNRAESIDDDDGGGGEDIDSFEAGKGGGEGRVTRVKAEVASGMGRTAGLVFDPIVSTQQQQWQQQQMMDNNIIPGSQVVDLGDGDGDEDEE
ncbi:MAG: hypothetical protein M1812_006479 [Candelaria pacifica]|nr:MAG: hypothetical protein M1812_006479 [Candelaria pacifica]